MPKNMTLVNQAKDKGITVYELCKRAISEYRTLHNAANALGVYDNAIRWHLKKSAPAQIDMQPTEESKS